MAGKNGTRELKNPRYEVFILCLSLLSIFNFFMLILPFGDEVVKDVIELIDLFTAMIFFVDFLYRFLTADSKLDYFFRNWGWADLLASMPLHYFRIFRIFRIVRVIRLLREFGSGNVLAALRAHRAESVLIVVILMVVLVVEFGGMAIVYAEAEHPDSNIKTGGDGVWWTFVSITTVGYGDRVPVTPLGRTMGILVLILGVSTYGAFTGYVTNAFLSGRAESPDESNQVDGTGEISELRSILEEQAKLNRELRHKLEQIERSIEHDR